MSLRRDNRNAARLKEVDYQLEQADYIVCELIRATWVVDSELDQMMRKKLEELRTLLGCAEAKKLNAMQKYWEKRGLAHLLPSKT